MEGGLKEESKMKSVLGDSSLEAWLGSLGTASDGVTVFSTRNLEPEERKESSADASCGTRARYVDSLAAMVSLFILSLVGNDRALSQGMFLPVLPGGSDMTTQIYHLQFRGVHVCLRDFLMRPQRDVRSQSKLPKGEAARCSSPAFVVTSWPPVRKELYDSASLSSWLVESSSIAISAATRLTDERSYGTWLRR